MSIRGGAALGLLITLLMALWYLPGVAESLRAGGDAAALAARLLAALLVVRALTVVALGWSVSYPLAPGKAALTLMAVSAMAWPLVLLARWSVDLPVLMVIGAESALLVLAIAIAYSAQLLRSIPGNGEQRATLALTAGLLCAVGLWQWRSLYLDWLLQ